jgi:hypothetical protein
MPSIFTSGTYIISEELMYSSSIYQDSIFVICNTSLAPVNIILPSVDETKSFSNFILISDASENASTNNITISTAVGQTINNASSIVINVDGGSCLCLVSSSSLNQIGGQPITSKWVALQSNQSGGGGSYTANNGLNLAGSTFKLGGSLLENTTITNNGFDFIVSRSTVGGDAIKGVNTDGVGVRGQSTSQAAVIGVSSSNSGVSGVSTTGQAITGTVFSTTSNDIKTILRLNNSKSSPSNGIGAAIDFFVGTSSSSQVLAGKLGLLWTDVNNSTRKSKFFVSNVNNGLEENKLEVESTGQVIFNKYGINTFVGTPTKLLGVDASGNVVETTSIAARNYGSFYDTTLQIASGVNTVDAMKLNSTDSSATNGISIVNDTFGNPTKITVTKTSTYNIQFSAQLNRIGGGALRQTSIWLRKNGVDVPNTNTHISVQTNSNKVVAAWNFVISLNAGDNVQLMWSVQDIDIELLYEPQNLLIPHPATPSVILTITEV